MTKVVTFYSYKGGVGRTMALVNAAHALARRGLRILLVDLDLEAPGMTHFFATQVRKHSGKARKDALDFLLDVKRNIVHEEPARSFSAVSLNEYVIPIPLPSEWTKQSESQSRYLVGRLDLLPATLDPTLLPAPTRSYLERLTELDLPGIFGPHGLGHLFGNRVRRHLENVRFEAPGDPVYTLRKTVLSAYDLILVDSRTGLNESSGLCIGPLCDALVICTGLNEQNVAGTQFFMQQAGLFERSKSKAYAVVVGPIPPWSTEQTETRLARIRSTLRVADIAAGIPYHPAAALGEPVFVLQNHPEPIGAAYDGLAERIMVLANIRDAHVPRLEQNVVEDDSYQEAFARALPLLRLERHSLHGVIPTAPFPTGAAFGGLHETPSWGDVGTVVPTAVAALYLKSEEPFERMLTKEKRTRDEETTGQLLFMRLRLADRLPLPKGKHDWVSKLLARDPRSETEHVALAYAAALGIRARKGNEPAPYGMLRHLVRRWQPPLDDLFLFDRSDFIKVVFDAKLPDKIRSKLAHDFEDSEALLRRYTKEISGHRLDGIRFEVHSHTPPGLWPLPLLASLVGLVKGAAAIDEILKWIGLCRRAYGYAWRVLVDWRQLAPIRKHPKFVAFVAEEDNRVAKIEAAIDSGEYPL